MDTENNDNKSPLDMPTRIIGTILIILMTPLVAAAGLIIGTIVGVALPLFMLTELWHRRSWTPPWRKRHDCEPSDN